MQFAGKFLNATHLQPTAYPKPSIRTRLKPIPKPPALDLGPNRKLGKEAKEPYDVGAMFLQPGIF